MPAPTGGLAITVRPWGTIFIDGVIHSRETDVRYEATLPVGRHHIRVVHPTLGTYETTVRVRHAVTADLVMDLNEATEPASSGG
jgi:hypothetical protein